jgi:hypothetical protein
MSLRNIGLIAVATFFGAVGTASAASVLNTSLTNPPGVYFGSGNANSNFTVDRTNGIEIGLSAIERFIGPDVPTGSTYFVPTGATTVPGKTGPDWGFIFSVNLDYNGSNESPSLANYSTRLTLNDVGRGTTGSFDPKFIPDNSTYNGYAFQNSENLGFTSIATLLGDPLYDVNANDTYIFTLSVLSGLSTVLSSDQITVVAGRGAQPVPEPLTLSLFAAGLVGFGIVRRRKKAQQA